MGLKVLLPCLVALYMTLPWQLMLVGIQEDSEKTLHTLQPAED